jgi:hypothetical protein
MRNIVDEMGEIIAKATDDHTVIGGHHRPHRIERSLQTSPQGIVNRFQRWYRHLGSSAAPVTAGEDFHHQCGQEDLDGLGACEPPNPRRQEDESAPDQVPRQEVGF